MGSWQATASNHRQAITAAIHLLFGAPTKISKVQMASVGPRTKSTHLDSRTILFFPSIVKNQETSMLQRQDLKPYEAIESNSTPIDSSIRSLL